MPLVLVLVPVLIDEPGLDEAGHVGLERQMHDVSARPCSTARDCSPELPYDCSKPMPSPSGVSLNAGMISSCATSGVE